MTEGKKSFWSSLPGILTGFAAVITAVTGLYVALKPNGAQPIPQPDTAIHSPNPAPTSPSESIQTVEVILPGSEVRNRYGFFTPKGFIVTMKEGIEEGAELMVIWHDGDGEKRIQAKPIRTGMQQLPVVLLRPQRREMERHALPIRSSSTLNIGEEVKKNLETDRSSGKVLEILAEKTVWSSDGNLVIKNAIVTTNFSIGGDAGVPVTDNKDNVIGMLYGASQTETIIIPIEDIKTSFIQAF